MSDPTTDDLGDLWPRFRERHPDVCVRETALALGVPEAALRATRCGDDVVRLTPEWPAILADLPTLGPVIAATRGRYALLEQRAQYDATEVLDGGARMMSEGFELSCALDRFDSVFAVHDEGRPRLEFFDRGGNAAHKVFLDRGSDARAFRELVGRYAAADQSGRHLARSAPSLGSRPSELDRAAFCAAWRMLEDPDAFEELLDVHGVSRVQALRAAASDLAYAVPRSTIPRLLRRVSLDGTPVLVRVASDAATHRYVGPIRRVTLKPRWLVVRDPAVCLQLRVDRLASTWVVKLPSRAGTVTAIEAFDAADGSIIRIRGTLTPGSAAADGWRALVERIAAPPLAAG